MASRPVFRRKNYFIKKGFQLSFSGKFLVLIVVEALLAIGLFVYLARGTMTTGYLGSNFTIARTSDFFLPTLFLANLAVIGVIGVMGVLVLIWVSHRIAGPLYRFEHILAEVGGGDLTQRYKLRDKDQLTELAEGMTQFTDSMDGKLGDIKTKVREISKQVSGIQSAVTAGRPPDQREMENLMSGVSQNIQELEEVLNYFKTSEDRGIERP
jgi:methyl-accepting chemotaxis protein